MTWTIPEGSQSTATKTLCPEGEHVGKIIGVDIKTFPFKVAPENSFGETLVIRTGITDADGGKHVLESLIGKHQKVLLRVVLDAAGITAAAGEAFDPQSLVGKVCQCRVGRYTAKKTGQPKDCINRWSKLPQTAPRAAAPQDFNTSRRQQRTSLELASDSSGDLPW